MLTIKEYSEKYEKVWDKFVLDQSMNGTFLQTRLFLNYHPKNRFNDNSIMFFKGTAIVAVIPANVVMENNERILISHQGSTFGGIVLGSNFKKISICEEIFQLLDTYLRENKFREIRLKYTSDVYSEFPSEILDYYSFLYGYTPSYEMGYYIKFSTFKDDVLSNCSSSKRRDYRYSLKNNLFFCELISDEDVILFYEILCDNYLKFDKTPIHTVQELLDFKNNRLTNIVHFYGVKQNDELIAGGMVFTFNKNVFHTQYLACKQDKTCTFANEFMYVNLIEEAKKNNYEKLSFGTSTLNGGKVLNTHLAQFKEGFGTTEYINKTYVKRIDENENGIC